MTADTMTHQPDVAAELAWLRRQVERLGGDPQFPLPPIPAPEPDSLAGRALARQARENALRIAAARAEDARIIAEREAAEEAAREAEIERQAKWENWAPQRAAAWVELDKLEPLIAEAEDRVEELHAERRRLRGIAQRFAKPIPVPEF